MRRLRDTLAVELTGLVDRAFAEASGCPSIARTWAECGPYKEGGPRVGSQEHRVTKLKLTPSSQSSGVFILSICDSCRDGTQVSADSACKGMIMTE